MGKTMTRNKELPTFFGEVQIKGERLQADFENNIKPTVFYQHPQGQLWQGDSIEWLKSLPDESVDMVFADPPYNIKKADWDTFESQEEYDAYMDALAEAEYIEQAAAQHEYDMFIASMFDMKNQQTFKSKASNATLEYINNNR